MRYLACFVLALVLLLPVKAYADHPDSRENMPLAIEVICQPKYEWSCEEAIEVAKCESHLVITAYNKYGPYVGWFQVHEGSFDVVENTAQAYEKWLARGWGPWPHCGKPFV